MSNSDSGETPTMTGLEAVFRIGSLVLLAWHLNKHSCACGHAPIDHNRAPDFTVSHRFGSCAVKGCECVGYRRLRRPVADGESK